ncbi:glycoside hydrolase family 43 protein [Demequina iriomotensis]|uniref:glycoside hydrolase family 43 protein n=1 Tax=Demequina iriomotensis TaxID=1536641 RepID=UPI000AE241EA|nr:glycoside hydrolase family 43 protein [Demequina iriomotensis]
MTTTHRLGDIPMRDPFIVEPSPGSYVLYGTTDANIWRGPATGFDCYTSDDLETWHGPVAAFRPRAGFWSTSQFWAPEVHRHGGRWYLIATFLHAITGVRGVGILAADAPTGPFEPWSDGPVTPRDTPSLDGTLHVDDAGLPWLVYSRGAETNGACDDDAADGAMHAMRLTQDLRGPADAPQVLFHASDAAWTRPVRFAADGPSAAELGLAEDPLLTDGPFVVRTDGILTMLWSSFGDDGYSLGQATSSGGILGPWEQSTALVWSRDGGHGMLLRTSAGADYLVIHSPNDTPQERPILVPVELGGGAVRPADGGGDGAA